MKNRGALCRVPAGEVNRRLQPWAGANWMSAVGDWEIVAMTEDRYAGRVLVTEQKEIVVGCLYHVQYALESRRVQTIGAGTGEVEKDAKLVACNVIAAAREENCVRPGSIRPIRLILETLDHS